MISVHMVIQSHRCHSGRNTNCVYLLLRLIDPQQEHQLRQEHGRRRVGVDAPRVGLEASEAGEDEDGEEKRQHGEAQRGVGDQGQCLQIALQLLLAGEGSRWGHTIERSGEGKDSTLCKPPL